jgi:hypothetical protein
MNVHAVDAMARVASADSEQLAFSGRVQNRDFCVEVIQDCMNNGLAGLPVAPAPASVLKLS